MLRTIGRTVGWVVMGMAVLWAGFLVSVRTKFQPVLRPWRRLLRGRVNPRMLRDAGQPGANASVIHHIGRASGTAFSTPVVAVPAEDGFVIALPYGPESDWVQNVVAAGAAAIDHDGQHHRLDRPELRHDDTWNRHFPPKERRTHRLYGTRDFLLLHRTGSSSGSGLSSGSGV